MFCPFKSKTDASALLPDIYVEKRATIIRYRVILQETREKEICGKKLFSRIFVK